MTTNQSDIELRAREIIGEVTDKLVEATPTEDLNTAIIDALAFRCAVNEASKNEVKWGGAE
jgi:hypothetical protein